MSQKISVVIPYYNNQNQIERMLDSIDFGLIQEIIIVDDCSKIPCSINRDKVFVLRNSQNKGPSYCRNRGIAAAKGDYILLADADDQFIHFDKFISFVDFEKDINIFRYYTEFSDGSTRFEQNRQDIKKPYIFGNLYKKYLFDIFQFDENLRHLQDCAILNLFQRLDTIEQIQINFVPIINYWHRFNTNSYTNFTNTTGNYAIGTLIDSLIAKISEINTLINTDQIRILKNQELRTVDLGHLFFYYIILQNVENEDLTNSFKKYLQLLYSVDDKITPPWKIRQNKLVEAYRFLNPDIQDIACYKDDLEKKPFVFIDDFEKFCYNIINE